MQRRISIDQAMPWLVLACGTISAIVYGWNRGSLWEDEIIAITHSLQPLPSFFIEILRADIHPFLYFLLLKIWTFPNLGSDTWALASSLVGTLFSVSVIWFITQRIHGGRAALWAAALFCILPSTVAAAGNLRMYAIAPAIAVACWYANREFLRKGNPRWAICLVFFELAQLYTHAINFFFAAFFALAALAEQWGSVDRQRLTKWVTLQLLLGILTIPVVVSALVRGTEPLPSPSFAGMVHASAYMISGGQVSNFPFAFQFGLATLVILIGIALMGGRSNRVLIAIVPCGALLTSMIVGSFGKPMFKAPVFASNLLPFLIIAAAASIDKFSSRFSRFATHGFVLVLTVWVLAWAHNSNLSGAYRPAAEYVARNAKPGDIVVVPRISVFWGVLRYAVGPEWGRPLEVRPLHDNEAWTKLNNRLGPEWVGRLGLKAKTDHVDDNGVRYVIGTEVQQHTENASQVWIVHRDNYKDSILLGNPMTVKSVTWFGNELAVSQLHPATGGSISYSNPPR